MSTLYSCTKIYLYSVSLLFQSFLFFETFMLKSRIQTQPGPARGQDHQRHWPPPPHLISLDGVRGSNTHGESSTSSLNGLQKLLLNPSLNFLRGSSLAVSFPLASSSATHSRSSFHSSLVPQEPSQGAAQCLTHPHLG